MATGPWTGGERYPYPEYFSQGEADRDFRL